MASRSEPNRLSFRHSSRSLLSKLSTKAFCVGLPGATDGHAKKFRVFLYPGDGYSLPPLYDVLTAQPSLDARRIERKQMKLAMSVEDRKHYRIDDIARRHFLQTGEQMGLSKPIIGKAVEEISSGMTAAFENELPAGFPQRIDKCMKAAIQTRLRTLALGPA